MIVSREYAEYLHNYYRNEMQGLEGLARVERWLTQVCPECGEAITRWGENSAGLDHVVDAWGNVLVGCEGYWVINPEVLGLLSMGWEDWTEREGLGRGV